MQNGSINVNRGSERNFGLTFAAVFFLLGIYLTWSSGTVSWWPLTTAAAFLVISFAAPDLLRLPNILWFKLGMLLGRIVAPIVMALVYVVTLVPMGLFVRVSGKDILHIKLDRGCKSYWIKREDPPQPMKNQF